ncbi:MAG TPA: CopD family protein [Thermomicrobiales bacterium]|nr:CopD family protein [Thermomicrobiales bacterium]
MSLITIWAVIRWLHLLSIITWFGGMVFILLVLIPFVRSIPGLTSVDRTLLLLQVGRRYQSIAWLALTVTAVTGYYNADRRRVVWTELTETIYGRQLHLKLEYAGVVVILMLVHAYWVNRRLARVAEVEREVGADLELERQRRKWERVSLGFLVLNIALSMVVVLLAASLVA